MLCTIFSIGHFEIFFLLSGFDISCKLSSGETICMKCQSLFFWKKQKNKQNKQQKKQQQKTTVFWEKNKENIKLSSAEFSQRVAK